MGDCGRRRGRGQRHPESRKGRGARRKARRAAEAERPSRRPSFARTLPNLPEPRPEPPRTVPSRRRTSPSRPAAGARPPPISWARVGESRGAHVEGHGALTMELSEYVQRGVQTLADPGSFDSNAFALLLRAAFQSLLDARADEAALGKRLARRRGLGGGAPGRAASPAPWATAPARASPRASPSARPECGAPSGPRAPFPPLQGTCRRPAPRSWPGFPARLFVPL